METKRAPRRFTRTSRKVKVDGYVLDSGTEAMRYRELKLLAAAGEIRDLKVHPKFLLQETFLPRGARRNEPPITYAADFQYIECDTGETVVEDVKGKVLTEVYRVKRRMFLSQYPDLVFIEVQIPSTRPVVRLGGIGPVVSGQERLRGARRR